jgi:uncharacterized protein YdcH (DUF465 family)
VKDQAHHILKRFPADNHTIDILLTEDPEFSALCEEYNACVDALQYWVKSNKREAETRVTEYRTLIQELEDEIHQAFTAMKAQGGN